MRQLISNNYYAASPRTVFTSKLQLKPSGKNPISCCCKLSCCYKASYIALTTRQPKNDKEQVSKSVKSYCFSYKKKDDKV